MRVCVVFFFIVSCMLKHPFCCYDDWLFGCLLACLETQWMMLKALSIIILLLLLRVVRMMKTNIIKNNNLKKRKREKPLISVLCKVTSAIDVLHDH